MSVQTAERQHPPSNPLDVIEEIVTANEWAFDRTSEDELVVEIPGRWCSYGLFFAWSEEHSALQFSCALDIKVPPVHRASLFELLATVNEALWLGHFDLQADDGTLVFRHTLLLRGVGGASVEQLEDLVDIAVSEGERFYPAFQFVIWGGKSANEAVAAALLDTVGEA